MNREEIANKIARGDELDAKEYAELAASVERRRIGEVLFEQLQLGDQETLKKLIVTLFQGGQI